MVAVHRVCWAQGGRDGHHHTMLWQEENTGAFQKYVVWEHFPEGWCSIWVCGPVAVKCGPRYSWTSDIYINEGWGYLGTYQIIPYIALWSQTKNKQTKKRFLIDLKPKENNTRKENILTALTWSLSYKYENINRDVLIWYFMVVFNTIINQSQIVFTFKRSLHILWCILSSILCFWKTKDEELFHLPPTAVGHIPLSTDRFCTVGSWTRLPEARKTQFSKWDMKSWKEACDSSNESKEFICLVKRPWLSQLK